jgi:hypothetical protein
VVRRFEEIGAGGMASVFLVQRPKYPGAGAKPAAKK